jgi:hypothetical protein
LSRLEIAADTHLLKLQRQQNKILHTTGNFPRHMLLHKLHKAFNIPYIYDYITKLCRQQANITQNHGNDNVQNTRQGEPRQRKFERLKLGGGHAYNRSGVQTAVAV